MDLRSTQIIADNIGTAYLTALFAFDNAVSASASALKTGFHFLTDKFNVFAHRAERELVLLEEGAVHMAQASDEVKADFRRDATTCVIETGLAVAEEVAIEATLAIAALESAEKAAHTPAEKISFYTLAGEFIESVTSSACAAFHSAINAVHDLEESGKQWEAHPHSAPVSKDQGSSGSGFAARPFLPYI